MDSKLPLSNGPESADDDYPRGARLPLNRFDGAYMAVLAGFLTAGCVVMLAVLYVTVRLLWALAFS